MSDLAALLPIAQAAVDEAAELARTQAPGVLTPKGHRDYASELDIRIERRVREFLDRQTPGVPFVGEEENGAPADKAEWWTLDPIDGTVNFAHAVPLCAVSLALVRDGQPVLGVVDLPLLGARYWASVDQGAHRDGSPLRVRDVDRLDDAVLAIGDYAVGDHADERNRVRLQLTQLLAGQALRVRMFGSAALDLAWLAEGKVDASITLSNRSWDVAAGVVIAREAGARVLDRDGSEYSTDSNSTIAASPPLSDEVMALVHAAMQAKASGTSM
jgi:myo-inositol-1(or 4)-monophosphatase